MHLGPGSPGADAGDNLSAPAGVSTDLDGNPRCADAPLVPDPGSGAAPLIEIGPCEVQNTLCELFCAPSGGTGTPCPCGNSYANGRGCLDSDIVSPGALLVARGAAAPDTVVLTATHMLDGVSCVGGSRKRLFVRTRSLRALPGGTNASRIECRGGDVPRALDRTDSARRGVRRPSPQDPRED